MSLEGVQNVIGKAVVDHAYRELLFSNPDAALKGHELTQDEIAGLKGLSRERFDAVSVELEQRILAQAVGGASASMSLNAEQMQTIQRFDLSRFGQMIIVGG